jgi:hypothetical protein
MKKLLLFALLAGQQVAAQTAPAFHPDSHGWMEFATPQQLQDSSKAVEARYERAQQRANLLSALHGIAQDRADDSVAAVRAAQLKAWSRAPKRPTKKAAPKKPK